MVREQQPLSLILFDVDFFKRYNDYYGHQSGDKCLIKISQTAKKGVRRSADLIARYGGEEFVIVLPNTHTQGAMEVAQSILDELQQLEIPHLKSEVSPFVTISLGIACQIPTPGSDSGLLLKNADLALYMAKRQGRNQYCVYSQEQNYTQQESRTT